LVKKWAKYLATANDVKDKQATFLQPVIITMYFHPYLGKAQKKDHLALAPYRVS
jgi:hypothetical protein